MYGIYNLALNISYRQQTFIQYTLGVDLLELSRYLQHTDICLVQLLVCMAIVNSELVARSHEVFPL